MSFEPRDYDYDLVWDVVPPPEFSFCWRTVVIGQPLSGTPRVD